MGRIIDANLLENDINALEPYELNDDEKCTVFKVIRRQPAVEVNDTVCNKWRDAKDDPPKENQRVLVFCNGGIAIAHIFNYDILQGTPMWTYTGLGGDPICWMPLPEMPKG